MDVSKAIITDLWPLYSSGNASQDTRALVETFLREDPRLADGVRRVAPADRTPGSASSRRRIRIFRGVLLLAMVFTFQAFGRIVSDTSWDVSPRNFIAVASFAAVFWIAALVSAWPMLTRARITM